MKTPVNKETLRQHMHYSGWKYFAVIAAVIFVWNLVYTMTAYRPPAEKRADFYIYSGAGDQEALNVYLAGVRENEMADMEAMDCVVLTNDPTYGIMQLTTYIAAGEGDVYLLPAENYQSYASSGGLLPLEEEEAVTSVIEALGVNVDKGWRTESETRERHLYGIPANCLTGLNEYGVPVRDSYLCVTLNNGNDENSVKLLGILVRDMYRAPASPTDIAP